MIKTHYTYMVSDGERYYIGVRSYCGDILLDKYMGSFYDKTFKPSNKKILGIHETREDAVAAEIYWQRLFQVAINPLFVNQVYQTTTGFDCTGTKLTEDHKRKISLANKGKVFSAEHKKNISLSHHDVSGKNNPRYDKTVFTFEHKDGIIEELTKFEFYTKYKLDPSSVTKLIKGKQKSLKGWKIGNLQSKRN